VIAALLIAAAVTILAVVDDDNGSEAPTTGASAPGLSDYPEAPWRKGTVPRDAVPSPYAEAWDRATNRKRCALLFPIGGGAELSDAKEAAGTTPEDKGWDIFLTGRAGTVEVLGLFDKATQADKPPTDPSLTRTWSDGSVAKYSPDVGNAAPGNYDPETSPYEALLTLPDQDCAYRIYDTLGRAHIELLFSTLRLMAP
jgi:hypothetical protein